MEIFCNIGNLTLFSSLLLLKGQIIDTKGKQALFAGTC